VSSLQSANNFQGPFIFNPGRSAVTAIIRAGDPGAKKDFCSHQANLAALESILPGLANAVQGDYRHIAATATSEVAKEVALDTAKKSTSFLQTVRSWTGIPMSVTPEILSAIGYVGAAVNTYGAMKAMQTEYAACMQ
jgi:hypothetical protein